MFDPRKLGIIRKRFSTTQGECELWYGGDRIEQFADDYKLNPTTGAWEPLPDEVWFAAAPALLKRYGIDPAKYED